MTFLTSCLNMAEKLSSVADNINSQNSATTNDGQVRLYYTTVLERRHKDIVKLVIRPVP